MRSITSSDSRAEQKSLLVVRILSMLVVAAISSAASAGPVKAWAWDPVAPAHADNVHAMVRVYPGENPTRVAQRLNSLPAGQRVLCLLGFTERLASHPADACRRVDSRGRVTMTAFPGPWCSAGEAEVKASMTRYFTALKSAGANSIDAIVLDNEVTFWAGRYITRDRANLAAIEADPRFPALAKRLGFSKLGGINWGTADYLKWNEVLHSDFDQALNRAVAVAARLRWPKAVVCNYGSAPIRRDCMTPDESGVPMVHGGAGFGTHNSLSFYGNSRPWIRGRSFAGTTLNDTPFDMFRAMVHRMRATGAASSRGMLPWIANYGLGLSGECNQPGAEGAGMSEYASPLAGNIYWDENVIQLAMHGCDAIVLWNPSAWRADQVAESWNPVQDQARLDDLLDDLNGRLGDDPGATRWYSVPGLQDRVLATGRDVRGGTLWRFSFAPDVASVVITLQSGDVREIVPEEGGAGAWYFESDDQPLAFKRDGTDIAWTEAVKGSPYPDLDGNSALDEGDVSLLLMDMDQESSQDLDGDGIVTRSDVEAFRGNQRGWRDRAMAAFGNRPGSALVSFAR
jgi:hypothetical protein